MNTKKLKTAELIGAALDWAVAKCEAVIEEWLIEDNFLHARAYGELHYSTDWAQGGPIKTRELISTNPRFLAAGYEYPEGKWVWQAHLLGPQNIDDNHEQEHESELIAAMRCYVASKLGDGVEVPDQLVGVNDANTTQS